MTSAVPATLALALAAVATAADGYPGQPCGGQPQAIPGAVLATRYDIASEPEGVAFHYRSPGKAGGGRPAADAIGIGEIGADHVTTVGEHLAGGGFYLGWTHDGEWARYTVRVAEAGAYLVGGRFASAGTASRISLAFSGGATAAFAVPTTAGFQPQVEVYHVWGDHPALAEVTLPAGVQVLTVRLDRADGLNVERLTFARKP